MYYNFDIVSQLKHILKSSDILSENINPSKEFISDIYDSKIYKQIYESDDGYLLKTRQAFTFSINSDGISICEKSKLGIWPIYLVINEIKPEYRYCIENVIIAGKYNNTVVLLWKKQIFFILRFFY